MTSENENISKAQPAWVPLESNPELMTYYSKKLGATKGTWVDVFSLEEENLGFILQPVVAVVFLFASSDKYEASLKQEDEQREEASESNRNSELFFMKQLINNACGAIAILHSLVNNAKEVQLKTEGALSKFISQTSRLTPLEVGEALIQAFEIEAIHKEVAQAGQTNAPRPDDEVEPHFVALVHKGGNLYELDGCRTSPINHGVTNADTFLKDAVKICRDRMGTVTSIASESDVPNPNDEYRFSVIALTTFEEN